MQSMQFDQCMKNLFIFTINHRNTLKFLRDIANPWMYYRTLSAQSIQKKS